MLPPEYRSFLPQKSGIKGRNVDIGIFQRCRGFKGIIEVDARERFCD